MPVDSEQVVKAVFEGLLLRGQTGKQSDAVLPGFDEYFRPQKQQLHDQWEAVADREKRTRKTMFAQESIKFDEVGAELAAAEHAIGSPAEISTFFRSALTLSGAVVNEEAILKTDLAGLKPAVRETLGGVTRLEVAFEPVAAKHVAVLHRTHPLNRVAGKLLAKIIQAMGLQRSDAAICSLGELGAKLPLLKPKALVALGEGAAKALLKSELELGRLRGEEARLNDELAKLLKDRSQLKDSTERLQRALRAGAAEIAAPAAKPWGQVVSYVRCPDGTLVELCTPVQA